MKPRILGPLLPDLARSEPRNEPPSEPMDEHLLEQRVDEEIDALTPMIHTTLARRMVAIETNPRDMVVVLSPTGIGLTRREETVGILGNASTLVHLSHRLRELPCEGFLWVLYLGDMNRRFALRQLRIDRTQLSTRAPYTLVQQQLLDALVLASTPQIILALSQHWEKYPASKQTPLSVFVHDTGPGIISMEQLLRILNTYGFYSDADRLATPLKPDHVWVWISTSAEGGTTGLRQAPSGMGHLDGWLEHPLRN